MSKFVVIGSVEQTFRYEIEADSIEVAQDVAAEKLMKILAVLTHLMWTTSIKMEMILNDN